MIELLESKIYEFGDFRLDAKSRRLFRRADDEPIPLTPKAVELLICLIENAGRVLTKDELLEKVWQNSFVEEANLSQTVFVLRKTLGEDTKKPRFILTIPNSGYQFIGEVKLPEDRILEESFLTERVAPTVSRSKLKTLLFAVPPILLIVFGLYWFSGSSSKTATANEIKTLAVLPFEDPGAEQTDKYLSISLADALVGKFGELKKITVRPTRAVLKYAENRTDVREIGRELQVDAVLDGRIQRVGDRLRVSVQLIRTTDNATVWAENFDDEFTNLFAVQDSISQKVVRSLALQLDEKERERFARRGTAAPQAYEDYLRGRYFWNKRTIEDLQKAVTHFEQAVQKDPQFALAHAGLADCYILLPEYYLSAPHDAFPKAKDAIRRALELDEQLAEAHTARGYTQAFYDWDWGSAEKSFKRALELNPNYATGHQWYAEYLMIFGRFEESRTHLERAVQIDPVSPIIFSSLAGLADLQGDSRNELDFAQKSLELDPNFPYGYFHLGMAYERQGRDAEASEALAKAMILFGEPTDAADEVRRAFKQNGLRGWWQTRLAQIEQRPHLKNFQIYFKALVQIRLGDKNGAIESLNRSVERRDHGIVFAKYERRFEPLRNDPRFQDILRRMGF